MKLPDNFENEYLSLLTPIVTDGTLKNRRNLVVASFTVLLLKYLDKSFLDLKILGINLDGSDDNKLLITAFVLIAFWLIMFLIHARKDYHLNKERKHLLMKNVRTVKSRLDHLAEHYGDEPTPHGAKSISDVRSQYEIFTKQQNRTEDAKKLDDFSYFIEIVLPIVASLLCLIYIGQGISNPITAFPTP